MPLRILWNSDRIIGGRSAYSKVTNQCCTRLVKMGYKVAHIPMGMANRMSPQEHNGILVYRSGINPFNDDIAVNRYIDFKADMLISLKEAWTLHNIPNYAINHVPYTPIDHSPVSPEMLKPLHTAYAVLTPSRHGQRELKDAGIENVHYAPHGVDINVYRNLGEKRKDCKKLWFIKDPDDFVVLMVTMNRVRKMNPRAFRGYKRFLDMNPDIKSHLFFWGDMTPSNVQDTDGAYSAGVSDVGVNLLPEVMNLGLGEAIIWPDKTMINTGVSEWAGEDYKGGWDMVKLYNMADVLLCCTGGEGFALTLIESQACGTPVICTDYASGPEQVGAGLTVKSEDYGIFNTPGVRRAMTSIDGMGEALTKIANADKDKLARRARRFSLRYDWDTIMNRHFKPFLDDAELNLKPLITKEGIKSWA